MPFVVNSSERWPQTLIRLRLWMSGATPKKVTTDWVECRFQINNDRDPGSMEYVSMFWDLLHSEHLVDTTQTGTGTILILTQILFVNTRLSRKMSGNFFVVYTGGPITFLANQRINRSALVFRNPPVDQNEPKKNWPPSLKEDGDSPPRPAAICSLRNLILWLPFSAKN